jgi:hypothetical protein
MLEIGTETSALSLVNRNITVLIEPRYLLTLTYALLAEITLLSW